MPPRRSQRIAVASSTSQPTRSMNPRPVPAAAPVTKPATKRRRIATPESEEDDADDDDDSGDASDGEATEDEAPAPKRKPKPTKSKASGSAVQDAPSQWKKVRGKRGILQKIADTPLDVLFEIFSYLDPIDLLRISRTTKDLRQLLMSKSSALIWERARLAIEGLPPKPDDLNDPQYINLLFDKYCHECGNGFTQNVQWEARLRLCKHCLQSNKIMTANASHLAELSGHALSLAAITPQYTLFTSSGHSVKRTTYYHLPTFQRLAAESIQASDFRAWLAPKHREYTALSTSCKPYEIWLTTKKYDRAGELAALRDQRLSSIYERLKVDGWTEELKDSHARGIIQSHKLVNQAKALTDRIWDNIKPTLTALMRSLREELLAKKIRTAVPRRACLASLIPDLHPFRDIIMNKPHDQDLTEDDFAEALATLPDICTLWRQQQEDDLKSKLSALGRDVNLSLAVNACNCSRCSSHPVFHYPYFASHACFNTRSSMTVDNPTTSWDYTKIKPAHETIRSNCEEIIRSCDLDPAIATAQDMDATDIFFLCEACPISQWHSQSSKAIYVMRWRAAMNHRHLGKLQRLTDPQLLALAKTEEQSSFRAAITNPWARSCGFVCNHCGVVDNSPEARVEHLRTASTFVIDAIQKHYRRSVKNPLLSESYRVEVPDWFPMPADRSTTPISS
ncbi:hypothetical protein CPB85DRAFT_1311757 [Mucidula mucida]|nr:hypothetical protein CPB85DRAFT_1311757 [Mucidula mucida]